MDDATIADSKCFSETPPLYLNFGIEFQATSMNTTEGAKSTQSSTPVLTEGRFRVWEVIQAVGYAAVLLWLNAYVCREMFVRYTPHMNSMQGFWIAMAQHASRGWFRSEWWRFWDC